MVGNNEPEANEGGGTDWFRDEAVGSPQFHVLAPEKRGL